MNNIKTKNKLSVLDIVIKFFFGFLIPYLLINGIIFFLFIQTPTINIVNMEAADYEKDKIKFSVDCLLPIIDVKTTYQDNEIPYTKLGNMYVVNVTDNGSYKIKATALNKSSANSIVDIEVLDSIAPSIDIDNAIVAGNTLIVSIHDEQSGINYDNLYATLEDGTTIKPTNIDKVSGTIQFQIESGQKLIIHVEDDLGNHSESSFTIN